MTDDRLIDKPDMNRFPRLPAAPALLAATLGLALSACAQAPAASTPTQSATARTPATPPSAATSRAAAYAGHFESDCQQLGEAFYTRDLVDLVQTAGGGIEARYAKAFHDAEGCTPGSQVVVFHMPPEQWTFDGDIQIQGRSIDRIQTLPTPGGQLTASQARAGWVAETPTQYLLRRNGQGAGLPVQKAVDQVPTKELRLLTSQRLYSSAPSTTTDTYPTELDLDNYVQRKPAP